MNFLDNDDGSHPLFAIGTQILGRIIREETRQKEEARRRIFAKYGLLTGRDRHGRLVAWSRDFSVGRDVTFPRKRAEREYREWIERFNEGVDEARIVLDCPPEYRHFFI